MIDPTGTLVVFVREGLAALPDGDPWRSAWVHAGGIPSGKHPRGVVIQRLSNVRERFHLGLSRYAVRTYGVLTDNLLESERDSAIGNGIVSDILHHKGPVRTASGVLTYKVREEVAGQPGRDPDTGWEYETSIFLVHAATQVVASD